MNAQIICYSLAVVWSITIWSSFNVESFQQRIPLIASEITIFEPYKKSF